MQIYERLFRCICFHDQLVLIWFDIFILSLWPEGEKALQYHCVCRSPCGKVDFSVFEREVLFWTNLIKKIKNVSLTWNLVPRLIRICRILWCCSLVFCFRAEAPFLVKFGPINQARQFKLKFSTYTNSNMQNLMVVFLFFCFRPFLAYFVRKIKAKIWCLD